MSTKYSFIGVGNIAKAFISAMASLEGKLKAEHGDIYLYDKNSSQTDSFAKDGYNICGSIRECVQASDFIFLCVKPQNNREVLEEIKETAPDTDSKTFVSVAAGISTEQICKCLGRDCAVIRTMPNTPMTIGCGVCAVCRNDYVDTKKFERICRIFSAKAELLVLDESQMNAIIGITGSSPAYVYKFIDALYDSAISEGLDDPKMLEAICKVFIGSAQMVLSLDTDIKQLIKAVKSPNGTTEKALDVFEAEDFDGMVMRAVKACNKRADTLGDEM